MLAPGRRPFDSLDLPNGDGEHSIEEHRGIFADMQLVQVPLLGPIFQISNSTFTVLIVLIGDNLFTFLGHRKDWELITLFSSSLRFTTSPSTALNTTGMMRYRTLKFISKSPC